MLRKLLGAFAVVALTLVVASSASALTVEQLKALGLTDAQATAIAAALGGTTTTTSSSTFTRDLTIGSTGSDVVALQDVLISGGYLVMPAGVSKGYFGALTASAVAKWQMAVGISPAAGYFGQISRAKIGAGSSTTTTTTTTTTTDLSGGAGDITVSEKSSGTEDEVNEGEEEVPVLGFEVEAEGSDVSLTSIRVEFEYKGANTGSDKLDRYVDEVQIMLGDEVVGSVDADSFNENNDVYSESIRLDDGVVISEDEKEKLYVAVTAVNNIDSDDISENWDVTVDQIRFEDGEGAVLTDTTTVTATFTFEDLSTSGDISLDISEDDESINAAHSVQVDDSSDTNDVEILSFELESDGTDIYLNELSFDITSIGAGITEIANDFRLMMGDEEVGNLASSTASSSATTGTFVFNDLDDDDVVIEEGDTVTFTLLADINEIGGGFTNGDELAVVLDEDGIDAEDENGDTIVTGDISGSADSTGIEFLAAGISVEVESTDADVNTKVSDVASDDEGRFEVVFVVKAIDEAAYVELGQATRGTVLGGASNNATTSVNFVIQDADNNYAATTTGNISLSDVTRVSGGSVSGEFIKINAGSEATFKLVVNFDPAHTATTSEAYRLRLYSVNTAATAVNSTAQQVLTPEVDYRTGSVSIGN